MAPNPHPQTLFHLVPSNDLACTALHHPANKRFVSRSSKGHDGLEVGYHVPCTPRGHVITRLGRNADLILPKSSPGEPMSSVHVAFEINPATELVVLSVRSKRVSSVTFAVLPDETEEPNDPGEQSLAQEEVVPNATAETITGDGVMLYKQNYTLSIASYHFKLLWLVGDSEASKTLAVQGYQASLQQLQDVPSRDRPTEGDSSEALSWHITRLHTAKDGLFKDIPHIRTEIGQGGFGKVYIAVDQTSGHKFAIKVIKLKEYGNVDAARALVHREVKVMRDLRHGHIIEYLGHQHFHTPHPEIFMPLREGSLTSLINDKEIPDSLEFRNSVLKQALSALDYLASKDLIHRDVKPDNILYYTLPDKSGYHFQLADFGLAHYLSQAKTRCGTGYYQAPELLPEVSQIFAQQSPKMDVWSLYATIYHVKCHLGKKKVFPPATHDYGVVLDVLRTSKLGLALEPMHLRGLGIDDS
ncbi:hypothetical protein O1611_g9702 [Lasiodiplodia mahajangana]|uniref:Uncharacterized protein n=1 Tax=Lasiodiplodia mahajangana TaxID=1108764 RepID=A0ACC2J664_9PEZI|nr:hypothetical protein O1611_g9702 [Lasiodiplodia mahajangana]